MPQIKYLGYENPKPLELGSDMFISHACTVASRYDEICQIQRHYIICCDDFSYKTYYAEYINPVWIQANDDARPRAVYAIIFRIV